MKRLTFLLVLAWALLWAASTTLAQTGGGYDLTWNSIDGGGAMLSTGGGYELGGTIGQPDAGMLSGGGYMLVGGFWGGVTSSFGIYLPVVLKNS